MEKAKKFFEEIIKTEDAKAILATTKKPENEQELVDAYLEIAKKLNVELTAEGILAYFDAIKPASGELDDDELAQLTGGTGSAACQDTFQQRENCFHNDGCDISWNVYSDYKCHGWARVGEFLMDL